MLTNGQSYGQTFDQQNRDKEIFMPRLSLAAKAAASPPNPAPSAQLPQTGPSLPSTPATGKLKDYAVARPLDVEAPNSSAAYVQIFHPMCKKAAAISKALPSVQEGHVVLIQGDSILPVGKVQLLDAKQYWTRMSYDDGDLLAVSGTRPVDRTANLEDHIETLLLCYTPEGVLAARASLRKTRSPFAKELARAVGEREGRWAEITGAPVVETRTVKKGENQGKKYTVLSAFISPIDAEEFKALQRFLADTDAQAKFDQVEAAYQERLRYLDSKV